MNKVATILLNACILLSLYALDKLLGGGFMKLFKKVTCTFYCFIVKSLKDEMVIQEEVEPPLNLPALALEMLVISFGVAILNKYKRFPRMGRIDELIKQSKDSLRETTEYLDKWQKQNTPKEYSYLDDEPQEISSSRMKLEIPILQLAMVDHLGSSKANMETGDAGEPVDIVDSAVLSMREMFAQGGAFDSIDSSDGDNKSQGMRSVDFNNRFLWDVAEEDFSCSS